MHLEYIQMGQQFGEKAQRLFERLNSITLQPQNSMLYDQSATAGFTQSIAHSLKDRTYSSNLMSKTETNPRNEKTQNERSRSNFNITSTRQFIEDPTSQSGQFLHQLIKYEQTIRQNEQTNCGKISSLNEQLKKFQEFLNEQNENRNRLNQNFMGSALKIEKNMQLALSNARKVYMEREKKLEEKVNAIIKAEKKNLDENIEEYVITQLSQDNIEHQIYKLNAVVKNLHQQLLKMKKNRVDLEDRIYKQFNDQIKNLKTVFDKNVKQREQRELRMLTQLKKIYKEQLENTKAQEMTRQGNERMFLTIIEQLIDRISEA